MNNISKVQTMANGIKFNYEGGVGYKTNLKETLLEFFSLGLLNGNFYQTQEEVLKNAKELFETALKECPEFATKCAVYGNNVNSLKLVPTVWLVYLSTLEDKALFKKAFPLIVKNPKMLHDFMEISRKGGIREGIGSGVKKVMNEWLYVRLNEYQVSRNKGKLAEIIKVTRPSAKKMREDEVFQNYMKYIAKDELTFQRAIALKTVIEAMTAGELTSDVFDLIRRNNLQLEELKHSTKALSDEDKKLLYTEMYKGLNYSALILNLVSIERVFATKTTKEWKNTPKGYFQQTIVVETDIPDNVINMIVSKIKDVGQYRKSNMLPFALINAEKMVVTPEFKHAIGDLIKIVSHEAFDIDKNIDLMVGVDTSGSMSSMVTDALSCVDIASLLGAMVKKSHTNTELFAVASQMKKVDLKKQEDVFTMAKKIRDTNVGWSTYFEQIMKNYKGEKYVLLITDSESADNLEKVWLKTKKPKGAKLIVWQLNAYNTRISKDPSVVYVCGYSDRLLSSVKNIIEDKICQLEEVEKIIL